MSRNKNPLGKAKIKSFSHPDNKEYIDIFQAYKIEANKKYISESKLISQVLKSYYEDQLKTK